MTGTAYRLVLIHAQLEQVLRELAADPDRPAIGRLGVCARGGGVDLLAVWESRPVRGSGNVGQITLAVEEAPDAWVAGEIRRARSDGQWRVWMAVGRGRARGRLAVAYRTPTGASGHLDRLLLVGPGMRQFGLPQDEGPLGEGRRERWSRTVGALGEEAWQRLTSLRYGVVGCGRTGSLLAQSLASLGVRRLVLVDPDHLETHNLGEMALVEEADVGNPKAETLAHRLQVRYSWPEVEAVAASVTARRSLHALLACDVLCVCADRDSARLATAILATLYLKPLLDIGTGVLWAAGGGGVAIGADVRLLLPGEGCLLCQGGLADPVEARAGLASAEGQVAARGGDWRQQRAGSLRSLNQVAVGLGLRLWEDLVAERRRGGAWLHLTFDRHGRPLLHTFDPRPAPACPLCRYLGGGDAAREEAVHAVLADQGVPEDHSRAP